MLTARLTIGWTFHDVYDKDNRTVEPNRLAKGVIYMPIA
jgi:hypothetical protein